MEEKRYFTISMPQKNHYRIYSPLDVYMELFTGTERSLLLDTGFGFGDLPKVVRSITDKSLVIICTHGHSDHTFGNGQFREPVYLEKRDIELCRMHNTEEVRRRNIEVARHWGAGYGGAQEEYEAAAVNSRDVLPESFDEKEYLERGCGDLRPLDMEKVIDLGGIHLRPIHIPGHTAGSIGILWEEERIFFSGDAMNPDVWLFFPESCPISVYQESLRKVMKLDFIGMYSSHHDDMFPHSALDDYLELALDPDYENGYPFRSDLAQGVEARLCLRKGYLPSDTKKPGYAGLVIGSDFRDVGFHRVSEG